MRTADKNIAQNLRKQQTVWVASLYVSAMIPSRVPRYLGVLSDPRVRANVFEDSARCFVHVASRSGGLQLRQLRAEYPALERVKIETLLLH